MATRDPALDGVLASLDEIAYSRLSEQHPILAEQMRSAIAAGISVDVLCGLVLSETRDEDFVRTVRRSARHLAAAVL